MTTINPHAFNTDLIEDTKKQLIFANYSTFKEWVGSQSSFISAPIEFVNDASDDASDEIFWKYWKIVDRFQSGNVEYRKA